MPILPQETFIVSGMYDASPGSPASPITGDSYICSVASGSWIINNIYIYDNTSGNAWMEYQPKEGNIVHLISGASEWFYNGSTWTQIGTGGGGGTPGGADTHIQYNNTGSFGGHSYLRWDYNNHRLGVGKNLGTLSGALHVWGSNPFASTYTIIENDTGGNPGNAALYFRGCNTHNDAFLVKGSYFLDIGMKGHSTLYFKTSSQNRISVMPDGKIRFHTKPFLFYSFPTGAGLSGQVLMNDGIQSLNWRFASGAGGAGGGSSIWDSDSDTGIDVESTPDNDRIRFYASGGQVGRWDHYGPNGDAQLTIVGGNDATLRLDGDTGQIELRAKNFGDPMNYLDVDAEGDGNPFHITRDDIKYITVKDGEVIVNESGLPGIDFYVKSDTNPALIFVDAGTNNVGMGTFAPDASAVLHLAVTDKGFLCPRLTAFEQAFLPSPTTGLLIYSWANSRFEYYDGAIWRPIWAGASGTATTYWSRGANYVYPTTVTDNVRVGGTLMVGSLNASAYTLEVDGTEFGIGGTKVIDINNPQNRIVYGDTDGGGFDTRITSDSNYILLDVLGTEVIRLSSNAIRFHNTYNFPITDGFAGQELTTDGAGQLLWQIPTSPEVWKSGGSFTRDGNEKFVVTDTGVNQQVFKSGRPIKFRGTASNWRYAIVTAYITGTVWIAGYPVTVDDDDEMMYSDYTRTQVLSYPINGQFASISSQGILKDHLHTYVKWPLSKAYFTRLSIIAGQSDTGANQPHINVKINNLPVLSSNAYSGLSLSSTNEVWTNSNIDIHPGRYDINYDESIDFFCDAAGSNNDALDLTIQAVFVLE